MLAVTGNLLVDALPVRLREIVLTACRPIDLPVQTMLHEQAQMPTYAYFLCSGMASIVVTMPEGGSAEIGLIGREGIVGAMHILGPSPAPGQCSVQTDATALRIRLDDLRMLFHEHAELRCFMLELVQQQTVTLGQITACNKLHEAQERLARWLLMARDRADHDTMIMTQEFLADMLGTRRTTVTLVAGSLERLGLIDYRRGKITILNRPGLEAATCDCYRITKGALERLYQ